MTKWISVKEKLPPEGEIVLGWFSDFLSFPLLVYYKKGIWYEQIGSITSNIYYWCELPDKPNSKNIEGGYKYEN